MTTKLMWPDFKYQTIVHIQWCRIALIADSPNRAVMCSRKFDNPEVLFRSTAVNHIETLVLHATFGYLTHE